MGPSLPNAHNWDRIGRVVKHVENQLHYGSPDLPPIPLNRDVPPVRGFLLQNIYGGGSGICRLAYQAASPNTTQVSIIGVNYAVGSQFKLALFGTPLVGSNPQPTQLFLTNPISVTTSAAALSNLLLLTAISSSLAVSSQDFGVELGNPVSDANLVLNALQKQPEVNFLVSPPESFVGSWIITVTGALATQYNQLNFQVVQDTQALMTGLSAIVAQPIVTLASEEVETVWDLYERPIDYPWVAGSLVVAISFPGLGYGIIGSNFRNQSISLPPAS